MGHPTFPLHVARRRAPSGRFGQVGSLAGPASIRRMTTPIGPEAQRPNPALEPLAQLLGAWRTTATHPHVPGTTVKRGVARVVPRRAFPWSLLNPFGLEHSPTRQSAECLKGRL